MKAKNNHLFLFLNKVHIGDYNVAWEPNRLKVNKNTAKVQVLSLKGGRNLSWESSRGSCSLKAASSQEEGQGRAFPIYQSNESFYFPGQSEYRDKRKVRNMLTKYSSSKKLGVKIKHSPPMYIFIHAVWAEQNRNVVTENIVVWGLEDIWS
jgi:hypothetical protein